MIVSRCASGFLILCFLVQPAYALPVVSAAFDPTKRLFTYDGEGKRISATEGGVTTAHL